MGDWDTIEGGLPTANQISYIREMCDELHLDYLVIAPSTFDEASDELGPETSGYSYE